MNLSFATVLFAAIIASLIAMPTPPLRVDQTTARADTGQLATKSAESPCAQQNWPNFDAACLRYIDGKLAPREIRAVGDQG